MQILYTLMCLRRSSKWNICLDQGVLKTYFGWAGGKFLYRNLTPKPKVVDILSFVCGVLLENFGLKFVTYLRHHE